MSALDLHPEELLDKAAAGTLNDSERVWLNQHLAQCSVCRFEQAARADFEAAATEVALVQVDDLVARALSGLPTQAPAIAPRRAGSLRFVAAAVIAMFAVGSFAAVWSGALPALVVQRVQPAPEPVAEKVVLRGARVARLRAPPPPEVVVPELVVPEPEVLAPTPKPTPKRVVAPPAPPAPHVQDAADLFQAGNAARIRGDRAEAAVRYQELLRKFPQSAEARLTHATLGRMLLDTGDARGALEQLDAYLALDDDTLREEAMTARARSLALLGRTGEELGAWRALLQQFPDSVHAERASARLRELGGR